MSQDTQPLKTSKETGLENTQPVGIAKETLQASQETQELLVQHESTPLPEWILNWAQRDEEPLPDSPALELDYAQEAPFVAPPRPEESGWGLLSSQPPAEQILPTRLDESGLDLDHELPIDPDLIQSLETLILDGKLDEAKNFVSQHKDDADFRKSADIALRKHLSIDEASAPLWEAYEMLGND